MAKNRRRLNRVSRHVEEPVEEVEVEDEELEEEVELEDEDEELEDEDLEEEEEEEEEPQPRKARKFVKSAPVKVVKPVVKAKVAKGKEPVSVPDDDEEDEPVTKPVGIKAASAQVAESIMVGLLESLEAGKAIVITKINDKKWQITSTDALATVGKLRGKEYWSKVRNPDYETWRITWREKSFEEKKAYAKKAGIKWTAHANARIEEMNLTQAVREAEGISKYKPEYASRSARAALRG